MIDDTGLLYYRKSMLSKKGVTPPTTMDEVIAAAKALDDGRVKGLFLGNDGGIDALHHDRPLVGRQRLPRRRQREDHLRQRADRPRLQKVKELNDSGALLMARRPTGGTPRPSPRGWRRCSGPVSGRCRGSARRSATTSASCPGRRSTRSGTAGHLLGRLVGVGQRQGRDKQIQAAKDFVKWLWIENTAVQQDWSLSYGFHVPPRMSAAETAEPLKTGPAGRGGEVPQ